MGEGCEVLESFLRVGVVLATLHSELKDEIVVVY